MNVDAQLPVNDISVLIIVQVRSRASVEVSAGIVPELKLGQNNHRNIVPNIENIVEW